MCVVFLILFWEGPNVPTKIGISDRDIWLGPIRKTAYFQKLLLLLMKDRNVSFWLLRLILGLDLAVDIALISCINN